MRWTISTVPFLTLCFVGGLLAQPPAPSIDTAVGAAKRANWSPPYVIAGPDGIFYAKIAPEDESQVGTTRGSTRIYRVRKDADELIDRYDWYAPRHARPGLVLAWSPIAGKIAVMRVHDEPSALDDRVELSFYLGGKLLKSHTAKDLVALGAKDGRIIAKDHAMRPALDYAIAGCEQVPGTNVYHFLIKVPGDKMIRFDILTGEVVAEVK